LFSFNTSLFSKDIVINEFSLLLYSLSTAEADFVEHT